MKKGNNKGFSLIELIIVIAIMAVLLVILVPSYLKYVERSRVATDLTNARKIVSALQIYAADPNVEELPPTGHERVTTFRSDSPTIQNDPVLGYGIRIDRYAVHALREAGLIPQEWADQGRRYPVFFCQSRSTWESYTIEYWSDGQGGIAFEFYQEPTDEYTFRNMMLGNKE